MINLIAIGRQIAWARLFFVLAFLLATTTIALGQTKPDSIFAGFAERQYGLFVDAYKKQDIKQYESLLKEFSEKYNVLAHDQQENFKGYNMNAYYILSCMYSLQKNTQQALLYLNKAVEAGYSDYAHISGDSDLNYIRNEVAFAAIITSLRENGDYLYILKTDNKRFVREDSIRIPAFTYQSADNPDLVRFRKEYKLDSIAGEGNEVSKMLNILLWVHNTVPHDGQHESGIKRLNGFEIISVAKAKNIGVSCGELATLLNESYLAAGFKSRKIHCKPKDSLNMDYDSHVIDAVYSNQLHKWLWMDPTNDAYVVNENGELLGINEVRNRLISDQPLILNPDANWNHQESLTKEGYLYSYMAKNLYRFTCTLESKFDEETTGIDKTISYVNLIPQGYGKFLKIPNGMEVYDKISKTRFIQYSTHDPNTFWQVP
jgi:hypothetical protein